MADTPVDPAIQAAYDAAYGVRGALLSVHFYSGDAPAEGTPADSVPQIPSEYHDPAQPRSFAGFVKDETGRQLAAGPPVSLAYNPDVGPATSEGWFIGLRGVDDVVRVVLTAPHDKPILIAADKAPVQLVPVLQAGAVALPAGPTNPTLSARVEPPSKAPVFGPPAWRGSRRKTLVELRTRLLRLGSHDDYYYLQALAKGKKPSLFVDDADVSEAITVILRRIGECLRAADVKPKR